MKKNSPLYIIGFMLVVSLVFGTGVSSLHYATLGILKKNERLHKNRVICRAFKLPVKGTTADAFQKAIDDNISHQQITHKGRVWDVYIHRDTGDTGFEFSGTGFWDLITGIIVLTKDMSRVVNIQFLEQKETPGLGARIEEKWFTGQFQGIPVAWEKPVDKRIIIGPAPDPRARNRVDAITGATQTSLALMKFLNQELEAFRRAKESWEGKV